MTASNAMWICATTLNHGNNNLEDRWSIHPSEAEAQAALQFALTQDNLHCAAVARIAHATEPHWTTGE